MLMVFDYFASARTYTAAGSRGVQSAFVASHDVFLSAPLPKMYAIARVELDCSGREFTANSVQYSTKVFGA